MPMRANEIKDLILETFPDAKIKIDDLRGDGDHYAAYIETSSFKGLSKIKQHQTIYRALGNIMNQIHALSIHSFDKEEYKNNPMIIDSPNCVNKK